MNIYEEAPKIVERAISLGLVKMPEPKVRAVRKSSWLERLPGESMDDYRRRYGREIMKKIRAAQKTNN